MAPHQHQYVGKEREEKGSEAGVRIHTYSKKGQSQRLTDLGLRQETVVDSKQAGEEMP